MSAAPLLHSTARNEAATLSRSELEHQQRVAKALAVDAALAGINRAHQLSIDREKSAPAGPTNILSVPAAQPQPAQSKKSAPTDLHPRVKSLAASLSPDAAHLLSLVVKADEHYRGAQLIDLSAFTVKTALGISENEATAVRSELERRGLIAFHDNGSGIRGFYPRVA